MHFLVSGEVPSQYPLSNAHYLYVLSPESYPLSLTYIVIAKENASSVNILARKSIPGKERIAPHHFTGKLLLQALSKMLKETV